MEESNSSNFIKFPKTPHLQGSAVVDDDQMISAGDLLKFCKVPGAQRILVQEKVDGANVSVHFEAEWQPIMQKRSGIIGTSEKAQYNVFRDWVYENMEALFSILSSRFCLFGEWLWNQHAVSYDSLPSYLLIFDIYDKEKSEWLSRNRIEEMLANHESLHLVPNLKEFDLTNNSTKANELNAEITSILQRKSSYSSEVQEGVYIRVESQGTVLYRVKLRRQTFTPGREDFNKVINNKLRDS